MTEEIRAPKRHISPPQRVTTAFLERRWVTLLAELILIVAGILIALYIVVVKGVGLATVETAWGLYLFTGCILTSICIGMLTERGLAAVAD